MENEMKQVKSIEFSYFCKNFSQIMDKYRGKWICIKENKIVSSSDSLNEVFDKCIELGIKRPFITKAVKEKWLD